MLFGLTNVFVLMNGKNDWEKIYILLKEMYDFYKGSELFNVITPEDN